MKSSIINIGDNVENSQYNDLRADAEAASYLLAHEQDTPDLTLYVEPGKFKIGNTIVSFAGGNSPSFSAPSANPRIDLLVINSSGTLSVVSGSEAASPTAPLIPADKLPICQVYNRVGQTSVQDTDDSTNGYIYKDTRPFLDKDTYSIRQDGSQIYAEDAEASDAYVITLDPVPAALTTGMIVHFKANTANDGTATLNVNSLGAVTIKKQGDQDLAMGDIKADQMVTVIYDGTYFQMLSQTGAAGGNPIAPLAGDGSDGDVTISTNTTLTRDMYYNNLTISAGYTLNAAGYKIFVKETLTTESGAYITANGNTGTNGNNGTGTTTGGAGGAGGTATVGTSQNTAGGAGGRGANNGETGVSGTAGTAKSLCIGGNGSSGGAGGAGWVYGGGGGGGGGAATASGAKLRQATEAVSLLKDINSSGGSGGGGGGGYNGGGGGAGAGASGLPLLICAKTIIHGGEIQAKGGNGGNGGNAYQGNNCGGGGGGGAGGHGGVIILIYSTKTGSGTTDVSGGTGGSGGAGRTYSTTGYPGVAGTAGSDGSVIEIEV